MFRLASRRFFSTGGRKEATEAGAKKAAEVPMGYAVSNLTPMRKVLGGTLAGAGLASYAYLLYSPHDILSPIQFWFKNRNLILFPT